MFTRFLPSFFLSIFLCFGFQSFGQQLIISNFSEKVTDLSGRTYPRNDLNGEKCALIKIIGNAKLSSVSGNVIGDIENKDNESWVYITAGTKSIILNIENALPLKVAFDDYDLSILSSQTYELDFEYIDEVETVRLSEIILLFPSGYIRLNASQKALLKNLVQTFKDFFGDSDKVFMSIESYSDTSTGSASYHHSIKATRARKVSQYLIDCGMNPSKIITQTRSGHFSPDSSLLDVVFVRVVDTRQQY